MAMINAPEEKRPHSASKPAFNPAKKIQDIHGEILSGAASGQITIPTSPTKALHLHRCLTQLHDACHHKRLNKWTTTRSFPAP
jgi:hypothetical protein